jgi:flagellar protein FlbD
LKQKQEEGDSMILLHRINKEDFIVNSNQIELIEARPDTVITMTSEKKYIVMETVDEIMNKIREYQRSVFIGYKKME